MKQTTLTQSGAPGRRVIGWINSHTSKLYMGFVEIFNASLDLPDIILLVSMGAELLFCLDALSKNAITCYNLFSEVKLSIRLSFVMLNRTVLEGVIVTTSLRLQIKIHLCKWRLSLSTSKGQF